MLELDDSPEAFELADEALDETRDDELDRKELISEELEDRSELLELRRLDCALLPSLDELKMLLRLDRLLEDEEARLELDEL